MSELEETSNDRDFDPDTNAWFVPLGTPSNSQTPEFERQPHSKFEQLHRFSLLINSPDVEVSTRSLPPYSSSSNQRQYSRCPIPEERTNGVLTLNGKSFNCRLAEMSIGGFGVVIQGKSKFETGVVGQFRAPGLNYVVSVTRHEGRPGGVYVGLKQLREIVNHDHGLGTTSSIVRYGIAGLSGAFVVMIAYYFMNGR